MEGSSLFVRGGVGGSGSGSGPNNFMGDLSGPAKAKTGDLAGVRKQRLLGCVQGRSSTMGKNLKEGSKCVLLKTIKDDNIIRQGTCLVPIFSET